MQDRHYVALYLSVSKIIYIKLWTQLYSSQIFVGSNMKSQDNEKEYQYQNAIWINPSQLVRGTISILNSILIYFTTFYLSNKNI